MRRETIIVDNKDLSCYIYTEFELKYSQGGFISLYQKNKVVWQYECGLEGCHVKILDKYLQVLPPDAMKNDMHILSTASCSSSASNPSAPWFKTTPIRKNTFGTMIKRVCNNAGISKRFTNHSLCAYGATTPFHADMTEMSLKNWFNRELATTQWRLYASINVHLNLNC